MDTTTQERKERRSMTPNTVDRMELKQLLNSYLDAQGWYADNEDDMEDLSELVHVVSVAVEEVLNGRRP